MYLSGFTKGIFVDSVTSTVSNRWTFLCYEGFAVASRRQRIISPAEFIHVQIGAVLSGAASQQEGCEFDSMQDSFLCIVCMFSLRGLSPGSSAVSHSPKTCL